MRYFLIVKKRRLNFFYTPGFKKGIKILSFCLLIINLTGCALIGTILQLAPLASIFVYYSAPQEIEDGKVLCFKTVREYRQAKDEGVVKPINVNNSYYICLIEPDKGKIKELKKILDDGYYNLDDGMIYYKQKEGVIFFALNKPRGTWQLNIDGTGLKKISSQIIITSNYISSQNCYAYLPAPKIETIYKE